MIQMIDNNEVFKLTKWMVYDSGNIAENFKFRQSCMKLQSNVSFVQLYNISLTTAS